MIERDANLHFVGRFSVRQNIPDCLSNRLIFGDFVSRRSKTPPGMLVAPLIVISLPRSGTTFLYQFLCL